MGLWGKSSIVTKVCRHVKKFCAGKQSLSPYVVPVRLSAIVRAEHWNF